MYHQLLHYFDLSTLYNDKSFWKADYLSHREFSYLFDSEEFSLHEYLHFMFLFQLFPNSLQLRNNDDGKDFHFALF